MSDTPKITGGQRRWSDSELRRLIREELDRREIRSSVHLDLTASGAADLARDVRDQLKGINVRFASGGPASLEEVVEVFGAPGGEAVMPLQSVGDLMRRDGESWADRDERLDLRKSWPNPGKGGGGDRYRYSATVDSASGEVMRAEAADAAAELRAHILDQPKGDRVSPISAMSLVDGLLDMIAGERLTEADIPDDWDWLRELVGADRFDAAVGPKTRAEAMAVYERDARRVIAAAWAVVKCFNGKFSFRADGGAFYGVSDVRAFTDARDELEQSLTAFPEPVGDGRTAGTPLS